MFLLLFHRSASPLVFDNRDLLLTRWHRSDVNPIAPMNYTWGNMVWDASASLWRLFTQYLTDNKIYQFTSANGRVFGARLLVLDLGSGGSWDDYQIGTPFAWCEPAEARPWRMIYYGKVSGGKSPLGLATSLDGITWERKDTAGNVLTMAVLPVGSGAEWDNADLDFGGLIKVGNTYYLYYNNIVLTKRLAGLATSTDLVTWTKDVANNPIYIGTIGADIVGATPDDNQGRFCPDIVRWDTAVGVTRYVMFVVHYTGVHTLPEIEVYTCASPLFYRANRSYVGTMFRTSTTPLSRQNGVVVNSSGIDTPRLVTDDITRNIKTSTRTGNEVWSVNGIFAGSWNQELLVYNKTLPGKTEADATLAGCKFVNISQDLPVMAPVIKLAPVGADANVRALWLPGQTRTLLDLSGNGLHLGKHTTHLVIDGNGALFDATASDLVYRSPGFVDDPVVTILEADRTNWSVEFILTFTAVPVTGTFQIYDHEKSGNNLHINIRILGGTPNLSWRAAIGTGGGGLSQTAIQAVAEAAFTPGTRYAMAVCQDKDNGKIYFFKDGALLNAGGSAFNYAIDDLSALNPPMGVIIGNDYTGTKPWNGYLDEIRVSNVARHTANYTPAPFVINYQASGQIFTGVTDAGAAKKGRLYLQGLSMPAGTSVAITARDALNIGDQSVDAGDFSATMPTGQYHQYLITLATTDATVTPSITGVLERAI